MLCGASKGIIILAIQQVIRVSIQQPLVSNWFDSCDLFLPVLLVQELLRLLRQNMTFVVSKAAFSGS